MKQTRNIAKMYELEDGLQGSFKAYYHKDPLYSNRLITTDSADVIGTFKSLPFGQELINDGIVYSFGTEKELDSSGLYYFRLRYYDPNLGRFTSIDTPNSIISNVEKIIQC